MDSSSSLPVVTVVLFIASGTLVFILVFIFAKRQIMRFALKSARKPHISIGSDAPKMLREEIQRRLGLVQNVRYEPILLTEQIHSAALTESNHYYLRMKALDAFTNAVDCCRAQDKTIKLRCTKQTIQLYLFSLCPSVPSTAQAHVIHHFCCAYNHARHSPLNFGDAEFISYMELLDKVIRLIKSDQKKRSANSEQFIETEVRLCKGSRGTLEAAEIVPHLSTRKRAKSSLPVCIAGVGAQTMMTSGGVVRSEPVEQLSLVDKSSGYSSTDHSSSGRGSAERLISPHMSLIHRDEAV